MGGGRWRRAGRLAGGIEQHPPSRHASCCHSRCAGVIARWGWPRVADRVCMAVCTLGGFAAALSSPQAPARRDAACRSTGPGGSDRHQPGQRAYYGSVRHRAPAPEVCRSAPDRVRGHKTPDRGACSCLPCDRRLSTHKHGLLLLLLLLHPRCWPGEERQPAPPIEPETPLTTRPHGPKAQPLPDPDPTQYPPKTGGSAGRLTQSPAGACGTAPCRRPDV